VDGATATPKVAIARPLLPWVYSGGSRTRLQKTGVFLDSAGDFWESRPTKFEGRSPETIGNAKVRVWRAFRIQKGNSLRRGECLAGDAVLITPVSGLIPHLAEPARWWRLLMERSGVIPRGAIPSFLNTEPKTIAVRSVHCTMVTKVPGGQPLKSKRIAIPEPTKWNDRPQACPVPLSEGGANAASVEIKVGFRAVHSAHRISSKAPNLPTCR
jgi:hypothetical protein